MTLLQAQLGRRIDRALGRKRADIVLKVGRYLNVVTGNIFVLTSRFAATASSV